MPPTRKSPLSYVNRDYRDRLNTEDLTSTLVSVGQTDLQILAERNLTEEATHLIVQYRNQLERYISCNPLFLKALAPFPHDPLAPPIVKEMIAAGKEAGVGPMAAVAGALAGYVGRDLLAEHGCREIIVENGGDIYLKRNRDCCAAIFAGSSGLSNRLGIRIVKEKMPLGVCTSSGTVGHSLSLGQADSVTVLSPSISLADAAATRIANEILEVGDIGRGLELGKSLSGLTGITIVIGQNIGAWGDIELIQLT